MLTRRDFLSAMAAPALVAPSASRGILAGRCVPRRSAVQPDVRVNARRLRTTLEGLSVYGRPEGGSFADGVSRVAYSDADVRGRAYVMRLMREAGLSPRIDAAGNIFGLRAGTADGLPPILFGSHIDSVPNGGNFDGDLGSLAALEVIRTLDERRLATRHPLEMVVWANEEGVAFGNGLCGSRAAAGKLAADEIEQVWNGVRKADAIAAIGGDPARIAGARRAPGSFHCYLELHIEQGGTLDAAGVPIGVVEGIVAINRYEAVIRGVPNHAGTTPMPDRHDALVAAAQLTLAVRDVVAGEPGGQVGTVGQLTVTPNAPNVIPGQVRQTIELRDLSLAKLQRLEQEIRARARAIAGSTRTEIAITQTSHHDSSLAAPPVQEAIESAAARLGLSTRRLPSGAGHDAQMMALLGAMGMIFVPSARGISHAPQEWTSWEDCARGTDALLHAVLGADAMAMRT